MNDSKPFQIQIDTHFIQRDSGPLTQTTTMFTDQNFPPRPYPSYPIGNTSNGVSPIKFNPDIYDSNRPSFEGGRPMPKINEYSHSPLQSRLSRPFWSYNRIYQLFNPTEDFYTSISPFLKEKSGWLSFRPKYLAKNGGKQNKLRALCLWNGYRQLIEGL